MTSADHRLSEHRFAFAALVAQRKPYFFIAGTCLLIGLLLLSLDVADADAIALWAGIILAFGLICLLPMLLVYLRSIKKVSLYEEGIAWTVWGREDFHAWDDVREVYRSEKTVGFFSRQTELTLIFKKTSPVVFDSCLSDFFGLATTVEAIVTERLLPSYRRALGQDGAHFGPIVLKRGGIRIHDREFAWEEVEEYAIASGGLVVTPTQYADRTGEFASFATIPNYLILLQLLEELGQRPIG